MDVYENDSSNYTSSNPLNLPIKKSSMLSLNFFIHYKLIQSLSCLKLKSSYVATGILSDNLF